MRKVLVVAYIFPPIGGAGVQRTAKFVKYLSEFGWQPVILTVSNPSTLEMDYSLLKELPDDLSVYRAPDITLLNLLWRVVGKAFQPGNQRLTKAESEALQPSHSVSKAQKAWRRFSDTWLQIPDRCIYWLPHALWIGLRIVKQCDIIYSTSAPFTNHLVAYFLHKLAGKPWIADFRDPWTQVVSYQQSSRLRARLDAFFEKLFLKIPDVVTVTCDATAVGFQKAYPFLPKDKFIEITNGFDAEDFDRSVGPPFDKFTIAYTGEFCYRKNTSYSFLQALAELRSENPELASEIKVIFAGLFRKQHYGLLKQWNLEDVVKPLGYISHEESIKLLLRSHVLLLTLNDELGVDLTYPGKLFEYLAAQKTILALVPEGATADLIRDMDAGLVVPPNDVEIIKKTIVDLYSQYKQGNTLSRTYNNLQKFERRALTERLAQCLDAVLKGRELV